MELRVRRRRMILSALALVAVATVTGALYPAFGDSFGTVDLPKGVGDLIGGGDLSTISGWLNAEIVSVYGPLVLAGAAISAAAATIAGEEEDRILALVLACPIRRSHVLLAKGAAIATALAGMGVATWFGLVLSVAVAGGGIGAGYLAAQALHLLGLGLALGALGLALSGATGQRSVAMGGAAAVAVLMYLVNGFAPAIDGLHWLKYLTLFYYYEGQDPLTTGVHPGGLLVLLAVTVLLVAAGVWAFERRDLRA
jgi:ABC-2 type transport system permease protein